MPDQQRLSPLKPLGSDTFEALCAEPANINYKKCYNYQKKQVCNWMIPVTDPQYLCMACRLNDVIPDLSKPHNIKLWFRLEQAKRWLIYDLISLHLPLTSRHEDEASGLSFRFMEDITTQNPYNNEIVTYERIMTGHDTGVITINLAEADPSAREEIREKMNERYRTLMGHFRHESGHYYWDQLVAKGAWLNEFRALFGDERDDYQRALQNYYNNGPAPNWQSEHISAYASAHPWEDWAESWAHYLHIVDTLETAHVMGFAGEEEAREESLREFQLNRISLIPFEYISDSWQELAVALNAMNRSMGLPDPYPFTMSYAAITKMKFVHDLIAHKVNG